jgi:uncharacterized protein YciI
LLGRDYWLLLSTPRTDLDVATLKELVQQHLADHVAWLLGLEAAGVLFVSGPLLSGPGVGPGSGVTVLRADSEADARKLALEDPFVVAGLRTFAVHQWRLNEGSMGVRVSFGTGSYEWQ